MRPKLRPGLNSLRASACRTTALTESASFATTLGRYQHRLTPGVARSVPGSGFWWGGVVQGPELLSAVEVDDPYQFDTRVDGQLGEDVLQVSADGVVGDEQPRGYVAVAEPFRYEARDGKLSVGERVPACCLASGAGKAAADTERSQPAAQPGRVPGGGCVGKDAQGPVEGRDRAFGVAVLGGLDAEVLEGCRCGERPVTECEQVGGGGQVAAFPADEPTGVCGSRGE